MPDLTTLQAELAACHAERDGWHCVVTDCEQVMNAVGTAESPLTSNLANLIRDVQIKLTAAESARDKLQAERDAAVAPTILRAVTDFDLLARECEACKEVHIFGFYSQLTAEQKQIDKERMVVVVSGECKCGAKVTSEYDVFTSPDGSAARVIAKERRKRTDAECKLVESAIELKAAIAAKEAAESQLTAIRQPAAPAAEQGNLESAVRHLIAVNAVHRDGTQMATVTWGIVFEHLLAEIDELRRALTSRDREHTLEELGDIQGIVVHAALKAGFTMAQVEAREIAKLKERFTIPTEECEHGKSIVEGRRICKKCGRPLANVNDFRAIRDNEAALDGLCPAAYAIFDPDAAADCEAAAIEFARSHEDKGREGT